jgi:hypothetical protein
MMPSTIRKLTLGEHVKFLKELCGERKQSLAIAMYRSCNLCASSFLKAFLKDAGRPLQKHDKTQAFNKCGICRHRNYFDVTVNFKGLCIESSTYSWAEAVDFHLCLSELKEKALNRIRAARDLQSCPHVDAEELLSAVRREPRIKLCFRLWSKGFRGCRGKPYRFRDHAAVASDGMRLTAARNETEVNAVLTPRKTTAFGLAKLKEALCAEMGRRLESLSATNRAMSGEFHSAIDASSLAVALQLAPREARQLAIQITSLPRSQFESRRDAVMKNLRCQLELTWEQPRRALNYDVARGLRPTGLVQQPKRLAVTSLSWMVGGADVPWDACGIIAGFLSFVDLAALEAASRGSKFINDCRMSKALRKFKYQLDVIGFAKRSRSGRVIRTADGINHHRKWLREFLPLYSTEFNHLNLTEIPGHLLENDAVKDTFKRMSSLIKVVLPKCGWTTPIQQTRVCQSFLSTTHLA